MSYAQIINGRVHGVFEYDTLPEFAPDVVMIPLEGGSPVAAGWLYDGSVFTAPAPVAVIEARKVTRLAFLSRFTDSEAITLDLASQGATVEAATMRRYLSKVNAATYIDLDRGDTRAGVIALEGAGILGAGRALEILDAPIQPSELPQ
jgi:hypothetical protein